MVGKIQITDINFEQLTCVKDKLHRVVDGVNHGRAIYFDQSTQLYYKIFHAEYCRINNFRKAIQANFFDGLSSALTQLIYAGADIIGYVTKAGPLLSANEFDSHLIPRDFFRILKNRIKESGMFFYDLVPHNIILIDGKPSLIDLESVYDISEYSTLSQHNAKVKPAELDIYIKELRSSIPMKISFIQPGRNNLKYLKWSYDSIRKNQGHHEVEICVADDFSNDGTWDWCQEMMDTDPNFKAIRNNGPTRLGHTILYDRLVNEVASHDMCMIYHADMYLCPGALDAIQSHMYTEVDNGDNGERWKNDKVIVSLTRIEPPLHPPGPEKILLDCGIEPEEFDEDMLLTQVERLKTENKTTGGIFAPWAFWKKDFQEIGGHDALYAPQSKEDSDIFNRFQLNGVKFIQTWKGFVYHMTCRGSRFADGATRNPDGEVFMKNRETDEWLTQNQKATREFIRKWGHFVKHDSFLKPIVPPKYDIGFIIQNGSMQLLEVLEPWCSNVYMDDANGNQYTQYIEKENTSYDLYEKIKPFDSEKQNEILIQIDGNKFTQEDFGYIQQMSEIIQDSGNETFHGEIGNLTIDIITMNTYEKELIICE
jgi:glycosyltransferase involved in cell wall biosynthesis|tara:strand:+ start:627 stop:2411 length:1785 start_codon:yes stop_codon:yes gene_type:complete